MFTHTHTLRLYLRVLTRWGGWAHPSPSKWIFVSLQSGRTIPIEQLLLWGRRKKAQHRYWRQSANVPGEQGDSLNIAAQRLPKTPIPPAPIIFHAYLLALFSNKCRRFCFPNYQDRAVNLLMCVNADFLRTARSIIMRNNWATPPSCVWWRK